MDSKTIQTKRDGINLLVNNYVYEVRRRNKDSIAWCCVEWRKTRCSATIKTNLINQVLSQFGEHQHAPLTSVEIIFKENRPELHALAKTNRRDSSNSICIREADRLIRENGLNISNQDVLKASSIIYKHSRSLDYHRRKETSILPKTIESIVLPKNYTICSSKNDDKSEKIFAIHQDENMIAFSSPTGLEILNSSDWWGCDGTFKVNIN